MLLIDGMCASHPSYRANTLSDSPLFADILKHTFETSPDHWELEKASKAIKDVMTYINEYKRKTDGYQALLYICNDIDDFPVSWFSSCFFQSKFINRSICLLFLLFHQTQLVSSHRSFISKCEVNELTNTSDKSNYLNEREAMRPLMIFLFTDFMEICKIRKSRGSNNVKSPTGSLNVINSTRHPQKQSYEHIRSIPLNAIPCVYDVKDSPRAFAITSKDKLYSFSISDDIDKVIYLKSLCKQLAENACRTDAVSTSTHTASLERWIKKSIVNSLFHSVTLFQEQFLRSYDSHELGIDISEVNFGTLKKVFNYARSRLKVCTNTERWLGLSMI